ncbi:hypothetical protein F7725_009442, partial [Dissostichus mawsoni]
MKQRPGSWPWKTPQEPRIAELEKQVSALTESLDMAENYSRRLNIQVVGLAEGTETGQPDSTGVEVDSDIFDELLNSSRVSFKAFTEECNGGSLQHMSAFPNLKDPDSKNGYTFEVSAWFVPRKVFAFALWRAWMFMFMSPAMLSLNLELLLELLFHSQL